MKLIIAGGRDYKMDLADYMRLEEIHLRFGPITEIVSGGAQPVKTKGKAVFAEGEGHHVHRAATANGVQLFVKDGVTFARFSKEITVEHVTPDGRKGEHNPITVPPGDYRYSQVQEYDYLAEMARSVID